MPTPKYRISGHTIHPVIRSVHQELKAPGNSAELPNNQHVADEVIEMRDVLLKLVRTIQVIVVNVIPDDGGGYSLILLLFQFDSVDCIPFLLTDQVSVDLGSRNILVCEHFRYGVDVSSCSYLEGRIGVPEAMEGNVLVDTGF